MKNIITYLETYKDDLFSDYGFNPLDALIFARLSYIDMSNIINNKKHGSQRRLIDVINDILTEKESARKRFRLKEDKELLDLLRASLRFKDIYVKSYVKEFDTKEVKQFSAITFINNSKSDRFMYISFRGTDGTITGWNEDFNMAYMDTVPSQISASKYLKKMIRFTNFKTIYLGGHSKGGNLAIYAASTLRKSAMNNITKIYSFDGPGFDRKFLEKKSFNDIKRKIILFVPECSIIGRLLYRDYQTRIVSSKKTLLYQHNVYNWETEGRNFVYLDSFTRFSNQFDKSLKENLEKLTIDYRKEFIDQVFEIVRELSDGEDIDTSDGLINFFKRFRKVLKTKSQSTQDLIKSIFSKVQIETEIKTVEPLKIVNKKKPLLRFFSNKKVDNNEDKLDIIDNDETQFEIVDKPNQ